MITKTEICATGLMHVLILFALLSLLFWFIISKLQSEALTSTLNDMITNSISQYKSTQSQDIKDMEKKQLQTAKPIISLFDKLYSEPDPLMVQSNKSLKTENILYLIIIFSIILTMVSVLYLSCKTRDDFPFFDILKDNIVLFLFVAIIEGVFFYKIAIKYIPSTPSSAFTIILDSMKSVLRKNN